ncbi:hypothetical protein SAVIM338S_07261 [Streptomyces avidinii]
MDPSWLATTQDCFAETPGASVPSGKPKLKSTVTLTNGQSLEVTELAVSSDRGLTLARLARPAEGIAPVTLATKLPAPEGEAVTTVGFGRTKTEWVPSKPHTGTFQTFWNGQVNFGIRSTNGDSICQGDTGGPVLNSKGELIGVSDRSWQGGCLGTDPAETRTEAIVTRTDDLVGWIAQLRAMAPGWKTEAVVQAGTGIYQAIRLPDGAWTRFTSIESQAGSIGGIHTAAIATAGVDSATHVVALGGDGHLHHTVRNANGTWAGFGDMTSVVGQLANITQVSTVSIGADVHVVAVADNKLFHTVRNAAGSWTSFRDISQAAGPITPVTAVATASVGGNLHVAGVTGGKAFHTIRASNGQWSAWGDVAQAAGATGPVNSVTMAGTGNDVNIVVSTDNSTHHYHAVRNANGTWVPFADLTAALGTVVTKSLGAAQVDGAFQLSAITSDGKILHTVRKADQSWNPATVVDPAGINGTPGAITITGTL